MREILFRAKAINRENFEYRTSYKNGDWVYGLISKQYNREYNFPAEMTNEYGIRSIDVDYKTVGQYTGLDDKNGVKIFEGDIVKEHRFCDELTEERIYKIEVEKQMYVAKNVSSKIVVSLCTITSNSEIEVIGNIYDNPELKEIKICIKE